MVLWIIIYSYEGKEKKPLSVNQSAGSWTVTVLGLDEPHLPAVSWWKPRRKIQRCSETRLSLCSPGELTHQTRQEPEKSTFSCSHKHIFEPGFATASLTQVLRMDERYSALRARPSTSHGSSAADLVVKLATGDVHLMQGWLQALGQHAGTIGVQVEAAFVASDALVHAALVALALVVRLTDTKVNSLLEPNLIRSVKLLIFGSVLTLSSRPSDRITTIRPCRLRPVRPIRCTRRVGFFCASKQTMRSTSPISNPSSPTQVDTSVLKPPWRNLCTT